MVSSTAITDKIKSFSDLQKYYNLHQTDNDQFFNELQEELPALDSQEQAGINRIKKRYDYHHVDGLLLEGTINLLVVSPLLEVAGFLDSPFRIRSPYGITNASRLDVIPC